MSPAGSLSQSVIALAGRRIDADNAHPPRFPSANVEAVWATLSRTLEEAAASILIASAACGSDLLALDAASKLGIRCRIVLPFAPEVFRQTSVVDRTQPAYWGALYDRLIAEARERRDLIILDRDPDDSSAYIAANQAIIAEALSEAEKLPRARVIAVIVWEDGSRGDNDVTDDFRRMAQEVGFSIQQISTLVPFE